MSRRGSKKDESESEEEYSDEYSDQSEQSDEKSEGEEWSDKLYAELTNILYDIKPNVSKNDIIDFHSLLLGWLQKNPQP